MFINKIYIISAICIVILLLTLYSMSDKFSDFGKPYYYSGYVYQPPYPGSSYMFTNSPYYYNYPWQQFNRPFRESRPWRRYWRQTNWSQY